MRLFITFTPPRVITPYLYEPEVEAYLTALSIPRDSTVYFASTIFEITGQGIWTALDSFAKTTKAIFGLTEGVNNLSTIFDAIYPFIGGTASLTKFNFVDPDDDNSSFRLSFSGSLTHSGGGVKGDGSTGYANTHWRSSANAGVRRLAYGGYARNVLTSGTKVHGCWDSSNNNTRIYDFAYAPNFTIGLVTSLDLNPNTGFHAVRMDSTTIETTIGSSSYYTIASADLSLTSIPFYLFVRNNNNVSRNLWADEELAFYFITGKVVITQSQMQSFGTAVTQLMTDLGRNI